MEDTIEVKELSGVEKKVCISITPDTVNKKIDEFFNNVKKDAAVPGFRKGRAPIKVLKKHFRNQALGAVSQMLISEFYQKTLQEHNINPTGPPQVDNPKNNSYLGSFSEDNSYSVELNIEVLPIIDPVGYNDIELSISDINLDDVVEENLIGLRKQYAEREQVNNQTAEFGDSITIDYKGFINNEPFNGGESVDYYIDSLGEGGLVEEFEKQLVGSKTNDTFTIKVPFPEDYKAEILAGQEVEFNITIKNIVRKKLAEVDDDLAMMVGFKNVKELKNNIEEQAKKAIDNQYRNQAEKIITDVLIEKNNFEIPKSMVEEEKKRLLTQTSNSINMPEDFIENHAIKNVKRAILLDAVYDKEDDIEINPNEMDELLEEQAKIYNKSKDDLVSSLYNNNQMDIFIGVLRAKKVVDFIINKSKESEISDGKDE